MNGILLVDKPEGMTSAGVIRELKPRLGASKVGHLGTLDPFASGLLPLCVGEATKIARYLLLERKEYAGTIRLGAATDTFDRTGATTTTAAVPAFTPDHLQVVAGRLSGRQSQVPPMYSALKRDGVPLYRLARRGIEVERAPREIEIFHLALQAPSPDALEFEVTCSKGTYVRVLAADIGRALGTVAHLERLRRTAVGAFRLGEAHQLRALVDLPSDAPLPLVSVRDALGALPAFELGAEAIARLRHGQQEPLAGLPAPSATGATAIVLDGSGTTAALIEATERSGWRLVRLLASV